MKQAVQLWVTKALYYLKNDRRTRVGIAIVIAISVLTAYWLNWGRPSVWDCCAIFVLVWLLIGPKPSNRRRKVIIKLKASRKLRRAVLICILIFLTVMLVLLIMSAPGGNTRELDPKNLDGQGVTGQSKRKGACGEEGLTSLL